MAGETQLVSQAGLGNLEAFGATTVQNAAWTIAPSGIRAFSGGGLALIRLSSISGGNLSLDLDGYGAAGSRFDFTSAVRPVSGIGINPPIVEKPSVRNAAIGIIASGW